MNILERKINQGGVWRGLVDLKMPRELKGSRKVGHWIVPLGQSYHIRE